MTAPTPQPQPRDDPMTAPTPQAQPLDPRLVDAETRQRVQQMMRSREFRFILDRMGQLFQLWSRHLGNPHNTRDVDMVLKGQRLAMEQLLKFCCAIAQLPDVCSKLDPSSFDLSQWERPATTAEAESHPSEGGGYGSSRPAFPA